MKIDFWLSKRGERAVGEFIKELPHRARRKTESMIDRLSTYGLQPLISLGKVKPLTGCKNLFELKINSSGKFIRIFFTVKKDIGYLLHAISKKQNSTPQRDINKAEMRKRQIINHGKNRRL